MLLLPDESFFSIYDALTISQSFRPRVIRMNILVSAPYMIADLDQFRPAFERAGLNIEVAAVKERLSEDELLGYVGEVDGAISGDDMFTKKVLRAARPRLKVISKWGTGVDSIDRQAADEMGIQVYNTPNAFTDTVADTVLGFVLSFAREIPASDRQMKSGEWHKLSYSGAQRMFSWGRRR